MNEPDRRAAAEAGRWAPSVHNTQPWRFRGTPDGLVVEEDLARCLPAGDPHGRQRAVSCGAAVLNVLVSLRAGGYVVRVEIDPDQVPPLAAVPAPVPGAPAEPLPRFRTAARLTVTGRAAPPPEDLPLLHAVPVRRTHRRIYRSHAVGEEDLLRLRAATVAEGAQLTVLDAAARRRLADALLVAGSEHAGRGDLLDEGESWIRRSAVTAPDGIPRASLNPELLSSETLPHQARRTGADADYLRDELSRSTVIAISTRADTYRDRIVAGMALERLLLTATVHGLVAGFIRQTPDETSFRDHLSHRLGVPGMAQVVLRVGRSLLEAPVTGRRPLEEIYAPPA